MKIENKSISFSTLRRELMAGYSLSRAKVMYFFKCKLDKVFMELIFIFATEYSKCYQVGYQVYIYHKRKFLTSLHMCFTALSGMTFHLDTSPKYL